MNIQDVIENLKSTHAARLYAFGPDDSSVLTVESMREAVEQTVQELAKAKRELEECKESRMAFIDEIQKDSVYAAKLKGEIRCLQRRLKDANRGAERNIVVAYEKARENAELKRESDELFVERAEALAEADRLRAELEEAKAWKDSMLEVEREWDVQKLAKMLGVRLGESCRKGIAEAVPKLIAELEEARKKADLYYTMRELSDNATDIAERREQERDQWRDLARELGELLEAFRNNRFFSGFDGVSGTLQTNFPQACHIELADNALAKLKEMEGKE